MAANLVWDNAGQMAARVDRAAITSSGKEQALRSMHNVRETRAKEQSLLERIANGEREAVDLCIERYSGLVWSLAGRFIHNPADAEEAVQDVFMELWTNAGRFDASKAGEATWVSLVARRRLIDRARRDHRSPDGEPLANVEHLLTRDGQAAIEATVETQRVMQIIDAMEPARKKVLRMAAWLGMSHAAIAGELDMPLGTVKSHLRRGLSRVREQLGESDGVGR
jgi:RNA polymerase sigma-70 factor (ECF subfamily)